MCSRCFVLCGTPAPNSPLGIVNQFNLADEGVTFDGFSLNDVQENPLQMVKERVEERGLFLRRTKNQVLTDLPLKKFTIVDIEMKDNQAALYNEAKHSLEIWLTSLDAQSFRRKLANYFQKRAALLQICVDPGLLDANYIGISAKYDALDALLNDLIVIKGEKVVIWCDFKSVIDKLVNRYEKYGVVRVDGSISSTEQRISNVVAFQEDQSVSLFIGNPAAAGAGLTFLIPVSHQHPI